MPTVEKITLEKTTLWFWKITENIEVLKKISLCENSLKRLTKIKSIAHQKSFLATRHLLKEMGYQDSDLKYLPNGKPYLENNIPISISHSGDFVVVAIGQEKSIGVDIEKVTERIKKIAPRFLNVKNKNITDYFQQTVIWCAKEAMYKAYGVEGVDFREEILVKMPFKKEGLLKKSSGEISKNQRIYFQLFCGEIENMAWVLAHEIN